jgi:hypothetical protein
MAAHGCGFISRFHSSLERIHQCLPERTVMSAGGTQPHENRVRVFYGGNVRPWA